jgi:hypothetical protein
LRCKASFKEISAHYEKYTDPDGTTYVCAISSESPLPGDPADGVALVRLDNAASRGPRRISVGLFVKAMYATKVTP